MTRQQKLCSSLQDSGRWQGSCIAGSALGSNEGSLYLVYTVDIVFHVVHFPLQHVNRQRCLHYNSLSSSLYFFSSIYTSKYHVLRQTVKSQT